MNNQPEALRMAKLLEEADGVMTVGDDKKIAAELRKLYELNEVLLQKCHTLEKMLEYKVDHIFDNKTFIELNKKDFGDIYLNANSVLQAIIMTQSKLKDINNG